MEWLGDILRCPSNEFVRASGKARHGNADACELTEDKQCVAWCDPHVTDTSPRNDGVVLAGAHCECLLGNVDVPDRMFARELCGSRGSREVEEQGKKHRGDKKTTERQQEPTRRANHRGHGDNDRKEHWRPESRPRSQLADRADEERALCARRTLFVVVGVEGLHVA